MILGRKALSAAWMNGPARIVEPTFDQKAWATSPRLQHHFAPGHVPRHISVQAVIAAALTHTVLPWYLKTPSINGEKMASERQCLRIDLAQNRPNGTMEPSRL